jgi:hypothetical protein
VYRTRPEFPTTDSLHRRDLPVRGGHLVAGDSLPVEAEDFVAVCVGGLASHGGSTSLGGPLARVREATGMPQCSVLLNGSAGRRRREKGSSVASKRFRSGVDDIPGVGRVAWSIEETVLANGTGASPMIKSLRDIATNRPFGTEDPRYPAVASFLRVT